MSQDQFSFVASHVKSNLTAEVSQEVSSGIVGVDEAKKFINGLLKIMLVNKASDLFIACDFPPAMKVNGILTPINSQVLTPNQTQFIAESIMTEKQRKEFFETYECNFAIHPDGLSRFRVNAFRQQGRTSLVLRVIQTKIPQFEELKLPPVLKDITLTKRGLVIFVGATGSGKSTSLAAMVRYRNENTAGHIITIEDPIEYVHSPIKSIVSQREVGIDTATWFVALKNTLRQAPDVILIGEIRERETMEYGIAFAETGHLCLSTLHANNANQALDRIINFFPEEKRAQVLMDLSLNLKAIISQRLIPTEDGKSRVPAIEVLINTPLISELIFKGQVHEIKEVMKKSRELGMQTFDQSLFDLYEAGMIRYEDALRNADSVNDLRLNIKLQSKRKLVGGPGIGMDMPQGLKVMDDKINKN